MRKYSLAKCVFSSHWDLSFFPPFFKFKAAIINSFYSDTECVMWNGFILMLNPQRIIAQLCSSTDLFCLFLAQCFGLMAQFMDLFHPSLHFHRQTNIQANKLRLTHCRLSQVTEQITDFLLKKFEYLASSYFFCSVLKDQLILHSHL